MNSCDVLSVGLIVADHICSPIAAFPPAGGLVTTDHLELTIGGCAANVAVDLAKLNVRVGIVGRIGHDPLGHFVRESLEQHGVYCGHVAVSQTAQTAGTLVVNVRGEDRRFIHAVGANAELSGQEVTEEALQGCRVLYVGGFGLNAALSGENVGQMFARARELGVLTILDVVIGDPELARRMYPAALPHADLFLPNRDEAEILTGLSDPWLQAAEFRRLGARQVIITAGPHGAFVIDRDGQRWHAPAYPVQQIDGTGGGDAFVAGVIYGLLQQAGWEACLQYGAALGASCVQAAGATTGVFREAELLQFVQEHPQELVPVK